MKKVAIYYATTEGQTAKIAETIALELSGLNYATSLVQSSALPWKFESKNYDAVMIGASVHLSRYPLRFLRHIRENAAELRKLPVAFFSVRRRTSEKDHSNAQDTERAIVHGFLGKVGIEPILQTTFGGALKYTQYGMVKRMALHAIAKRAGTDTPMDRDHEFTDWKAVTKFARDFIALLNQRGKGIQEPRMDDFFDETECYP